MLIGDVDLVDLREPSSSLAHNSCPLCSCWRLSFAYRPEDSEWRDEFRCDLEVRVIFERCDDVDGFSHSAACSHSSGSAWWDAGSSECSPTVHSVAAASERGLSHSWSPCTGFCEAKWVDCRGVIFDDRLAFDLDEDERDSGSGMPRADRLWPEVCVFSEMVPLTRPSMVSIALADRADEEREGGLYPSGNVCETLERSDSEASLSASAWRDVKPP